MTLWDKWGKGLEAQRTDIRKRLTKAKLETHADAILDLCRVSAALRFPKANKPLAIGASRAGGLPDVPKGTDWPKRQTFLLQLNLADVASIPFTTPLPKSGLLSFFVSESSGDEDDDDDEEHGHLSVSTVLYNAKPTNLVRLERPSKKITRIPERAVEVVPFLSLPQSNDAAFQKLEVKGDGYADDVYRTRPSPRYQLGGNETDYYAPAKTKQLLLLLSLSSSDAMRFFWGDADRLHFDFNLSEEDWKRGAFDDADSRCATA